MSSVSLVVAKATTEDSDNDDSCIYVPADIVLEGIADSTDRFVKENSKTEQTYLNISKFKASKCRGFQTWLSLRNLVNTREC